VCAIFRVCRYGEDGADDAGVDADAWRRVDPNACDTTYGSTPLIVAAQQGHGGCVWLLLADERVDTTRTDAYVNVFDDDHENNF